MENKKIPVILVSIFLSILLIGLVSSGYYDYDSYTDHIDNYDYRDYTSNYDYKDFDERVNQNYDYLDSYNERLVQGYCGYQDGRPVDGWEYIKIKDKDGKLKIERYWCGSRYTYTSDYRNSLFGDYSGTYRDYGTDSYSSLFRQQGYDRSFTDTKYYRPFKGTGDRYRDDYPRYYGWL